jgi:hypothetical protein
MALNPVERRLLYLCNHWSAFTADESKRLLLWQVHDNAARMLQCFFEIQKHQTDYTTGDLFIVFDTPFENSIQYSRALKQSLAGQYDASNDDLWMERIIPNWAFEPGRMPHSATGVVDSLRSLGSHHHKAIGHLVAVLMPTAVHPEAHDAFSDWLARALSAGLPPRLRLAVVDSIEDPRLGKLARAGHPLVQVHAPDIDALETAQETFAQEPAVGPAGVFRNLLMGLATLADRAPADQVRSKAVDAAAFARKQGWADQEVVIAVLLSGALLKEKRFGEALQVNTHAREVAQQVAAAGHPAGKKLVLQTWFGEAGTHLAAGDPAQAAAAYMKAAVVAESVPDLLLTTEALRMEAFCRARAGDSAGAIVKGQAAMKFGALMKPDARPMSTLPIAALDLLRVLDPQRVSRMEDLKNRVSARELDALRALERRAAELEGESEPRPFDHTEGEYIRTLALARYEGDKELQQMVSDAEPRFAAAFANGQGLLGPQWPLEALPAVPLRAAAQTA